MKKFANILTIAIFLIAAGCGENPNKSAEHEDITVFYLQNNIGIFSASSEADRCPGDSTNNNGNPIECTESYSVNDKGEFTRTYIRDVGLRGSIIRPLGTICKWDEKGRIFKVVQLDSENKSEPAPITHTLYAIVDSNANSIIPSSDNTAACADYFNSRSFFPLSSRMYATIIGPGEIVFHDYGNYINPQHGTVGNLSLDNKFVRQ